MLQSLLLLYTVDGAWASAAREEWTRSLPHVLPDGSGALATDDGVWVWDAKGEAAEISFGSGMPKAAVLSCDGEAVGVVVITAANEAALEITGTSDGERKRWLELSDVPEWVSASSDFIFWERKGRVHSYSCATGELDEHEVDMVATCHRSPMNWRGGVKTCRPSARRRQRQKHVRKPYIAVGRISRADSGGLTVAVEDSQFLGEWRFRRYEVKDGTVWVASERVVVSSFGVPVWSSDDSSTVQYARDLAPVGQLYSVDGKRQYGGTVLVNDSGCFLPALANVAYSTDPDCFELGQWRPAASSWTRVPYAAEGEADEPTKRILVSSAVQSEWLFLWSAPRHVLGAYQEAEGAVQFMVMHLVGLEESP